MYPMRPQSSAQVKGGQVFTLVREVVVELLVGFCDEELVEAVKVEILVET